MVLEQLRQRDAKRKSRQGQVQAFQAQRRQPEQEPSDQADRAGHRKRGPIRHAELVDQHRGDVRADRVERAMPERDLAVVTGEDVQAEQRDRIHQNQRELEDAVVADDERQGAGGEQHQCQDNELALGHWGTLRALRGPAEREPGRLVEVDSNRAAPAFGCHHPLGG